MTLKELRNFINSLPTEFDDFSVVNGEVGSLVEDGAESVYYRVDKPVVALYAMEDSKEICIFHQTQDEINDIIKPDGDTEGPKG